MARTAASHPGRVGRPWRTVSAQVYREESVCWLCGAPVCQALPRGARLSRTADHLVQLQHGGDPLARTNLRLAHLTCNVTRSNRLRGLPIAECACSLGLPCAALRPRQARGYLATNPAEL